MLEVKEENSFLYEYFMQFTGHTFVFFISMKTRQLTAKSRPVRDFVRSCAIPFRKTIYGELIHLSFIRIQSDDKDFSFKAICIRII